MLISLHVINLALIVESEVYFTIGLNILTGVTGAGESIIIGSIHLALGAKAEKEMIRTGAEYAVVELLFSSDKREVIEKMEELDLPVEADGSILIQRKILPTRSVCKINGETISSRQLKDIASLLINIHGQNDTQSLLNVKKYFEILDEFGGEDILSLRNKLNQRYETYYALKKELEEAKSHELSKDKELSLAQFEVSEIENADLKINEDKELEDIFRRMNNSKKIAEAVSRVYYSTGVDSKESAGEQIGHALREMKSVVSYDSRLEDLEEELFQIDNLMNDFNRHISDYLSDLSFAPEEFHDVEKRLDICNHLKSKYGNSIEDILAYCDKQKSVIEKLSDYQQYMDNLNKNLKIEENEVMKLAYRLSEMRNEYAKILSDRLTKNLKELNFLNVTFQAKVYSENENLCRDGIDRVDFLVSFNLGEPMKSLSLVASGGELSRFMLALKTIMADKEEIETLIFDEIDSGISGKTAWNVSQKMAMLGEKHQLICITHLPQIAAMADTHFLIEKISNNTSTVTEINRLNEEESIFEIARLLGTSEITDAVLTNARELKDMANCTKHY